MRGRKGLAALLVLGLVTSGCATIDSTMEMPPGPDKAKRCALLGGLLLGGAGAAVANPRHTDDSTEDHVIGAGVGAVVGAALGWVLCSLGYEAETQAPTARASAQPTSGTAPLEVDLRGSGSDPDGRIVRYAWDLGDGSRSVQRALRHVYEKPGTYTARLSVTDNEGLQGSDSVRITALALRAVTPSPRVERRIVLRGVQFDFDRANVRPEAEVILDEAARVLKENRDVRVEIAGHTDSIGPEAYNQGLSQSRAKSVRDYLVQGGIDSSRLSWIGYGESQPVADNARDEGRAQNRRVELNVLR
jgi:outer membrane protein OmpA-like peptidoglycan-associated protein